MKKTLYEILGVAPDASADTIRENFETMVARHESERKPGNQDAENILKFIKHAHAVLSDPNQRAAYDDSLKRQAAGRSVVYTEPFLRSDSGWRHWALGGTIAVALLVSGYIFVSYIRWKPAPSMPAAKPVPQVIVVSPPGRAPVAKAIESPAEHERPVAASSETGEVQADQQAQAPVASPTEAFRPQQTASVLSAEGIFEKHSRSVTVVLGFDGGNNQVIQGSGVVIQPQRVITNCHVVRNADSVKVWQASRTYAARFEFGDTDPTRDLCQIFVPELNAPAVTLGNSRNLRVGRRVFALGAPLGLDLTLSEGIVSGLRPHQDAAFIQVTAPISPGSSGGALFDEAGELVGITTFGALMGQNVNFAVPVEWIKDLPNRPRTALLAKSPAEPPAREAPSPAPGATASAENLIVGSWGCTVSGFSNAVVFYRFAGGRFSLERRHRGQMISGAYRVSGDALLLTSASTSPKDVSAKILELSRNRLVLEHPLEDSGNTHTCSR